MSPHKKKDLSPPAYTKFTIGRFSLRRIKKSNFENLIESSAWDPWKKATSVELHYCTNLGHKKAFNSGTSYSKHGRSESATRQSLKQKKTSHVYFSKSYIEKNSLNGKFWNQLFNEISTCLLKTDQMEVWLSKLCHLCFFHLTNVNRERLYLAQELIFKLSVMWFVFLVEFQRENT